MPRAEYETRMDTLVERTKRERLKDGIPLTADIVAALAEEAAKSGVAAPRPFVSRRGGDRC